MRYGPAALAASFVIAYGVWRLYAPQSTSAVTLRATIVPSAMIPSLIVMISALRVELTCISSVRV